MSAPAHSPEQLRAALDQQYDRSYSVLVGVKVRAVFPETEDQIHSFVVTRNGVAQPEAAQKYHQLVATLCANLREFMVRTVRRPT